MSNTKPKLQAHLQNQKAFELQHNKSNQHQMQSLDLVFEEEENGSTLKREPMEENLDDFDDSSGS